MEEYKEITNIFVYLTCLNTENKQIYFSNSKKSQERGDPLTFSKEPLDKELLKSYSIKQTEEYIASGRVYYKHLIPPK